MEMFIAGSVLPGGRNGGRRNGDVSIFPARALAVGVTASSYHAGAGGAVDGGEQRGDVLRRRGRSIDRDRGEAEHGEDVGENWLHARDSGSGWDRTTGTHPI